MKHSEYSSVEEMFDRYMSGSMTSSENRALAFRLRSDSKFAAEFRALGRVAESVRTTLRDEESRGEDMSFGSAMKRMTRDKLLKIIGRKPKHNVMEPFDRRGRYGGYPEYGVAACYSRAITMPDEQKYASDICARQSTLSRNEEAKRALEKAKGCMRTGDFAQARRELEAIVGDNTIDKDLLERCRSLLGRLI